MKKLLAAAAIISLAAYSYAYNVKLHAVDADGVDEVYATCRIFSLSDSIKPAVAGLTDSLGRFSATIDSLGTYRLFIEAAGESSVSSRQFSFSDAQPSVDLGDITLEPVDQLNEVTVTAQRPLVTKKIDRIGYDVQADPDVLTLSTRDMLRNVPMVAVDGDGNITVKGSSNFKVFKNGRPNNSMSKNAKDILAAIPASMIKTIEVITEPGAKYDAEGIGAILNIVTLENTVIKGVLGNASLSYDPYNDRYGGSLWVTSQIDKVTFSLSGGVNRMSEKQTRNTTEQTLTYNTGQVDKVSQTSANRGYVGWIGGEGSWDLNKYNLFTLELQGFYYNVKPRGPGFSQRYGADGVLTDSYSTYLDYKKYAYLDFNGNFNYQLTTERAGESLTASYAVSTTDQNIHKSTTFDDVEGDLFQYSAIEGESDLNFIEHTFQADWVRPFSKVHSLELGGKYILRRNVSNDDTDYKDWMTSHTEFKHITDVGALYAQYTASLGKVNLRAGLRYEYSKLKAEYPDGSAESFSSEFNDFVPSASASWNISDVHSLTFNYASRINRPGISYLNPAVTYTPTRVSQGNPDLESAFSNSFKLAYMFIKPKLNFNISASYSFNNDNIAATQYADANGIVYSSFDNIGKERQFSVSGFMQWTVTPKTRFMFNGSVTYKKHQQEGYELGRWNAFIFARITQDLPWKLKLGVGGFYFGNDVADVYTFYRNASAIPVQWQLSLNRAFLKNDRLNVGINASCFIGNHYNVTEVNIVQGDYTGLSKTINNKKSVSLSISYRFGSLNASVKKVAKSISNDDLVGRK